jgi:hypothetical protein
MTNTDIKDILAANQAGSSFAKIAEDKGIKLDAYKNEVLKEKTAYVDEQVKAGILTEAQANLIKERIQQRIQACDGQGLNQDQGFGRGLGLGQGGYGNGTHNYGRSFRGQGMGSGNCILNQ